ncbi:MAG: MFS transporter [Saprospiraceae bacterium]
MLGVEAVPALIYTFMVLRVSRSPRWLVLEKGNETEALQVLQDITGNDAEAHRLLGEIKTSTHGEVHRKERVFQRKYKKLIGLAFLIALFNQLSGINFVLYYAPELLERAGLAAKDSLGGSISLGIVNLIFTFVGVYLIDRVGRRTLLIWGSVGYILSLVLVAYGYYADMSPLFKLAFILTFVASHAFGQGAVIWVFISEIFPNSVRAAGQSLGTGTHWVFAALITLLTPVFLDSEKGVFADNPYPIFLFLLLYGIPITLCHFYYARNEGFPWKRFRKIW